QSPAGVKLCPPLPRLLRSHHLPPHGVHGGNLPSGDAMDNESIQGDERSTYVVLGQLSSWEREIAYGARALGQRSRHSSPRLGKPITWRRAAGDLDTQE